MNKTIDYYDNKAELFATETIGIDMSDNQDRFLSYLPIKAKILDAGCGSGRDTIAFLNKGYDVYAIDASSVMCEIASQNTGIEVRCISFEELTGSAVYDGIWACASLLHVKRSNLSEVLKNLHRLLKPNGVLYASFKYGEYEREKDGRYFNDLNEALAEKYFSKDYSVLEMFMNNDHRDDRSEELWLNILAKKNHRILKGEYIR